MPILATSTTLFGQNVPKICLSGDQSQGYVFDPSTNCFVEEGTTATPTEDTSITSNSINCYSSVGDGSTTGYIIPWRAISEQSLVVSLDGVKQQDADYNITQGTSHTLVTFTQAVGVGVAIDITGFQVTNEDNIKRYTATGNGTTVDYTLNWTAVSEQSLIASINGVIQSHSAFTIAYSTSGATILTFDTAPSLNALVEVIGIQGFGASTFRLYENTGDNGTTNYILPWYADTCGSVLVTLDGSKVHASDFTLTPIDTISTTLAFNTPPGSGVAIEVVGYTGFSAELCETCSVVGNNLGALGSGIYSSASESGGVTTLDFKKLIEGTGITLTADAESITISSPGGGGTFANIGTGREVLVEPVTTTVNFRTLLPGNGMVITENANDINIAFDGDADTLGSYSPTDFARTIGTPVGATGESLVSKGSAASNSTFELYSLKEGSGITITTVNDDIIIADANGGNYAQVNSATYNIERDDAVVGVVYSAAPITLTLPNTGLAGAGKNIAIKDEAYAASGNNILIQGYNGSQTIDGLANISITSNGGSVRLYTDGSVWYTTETSDGSGLNNVVEDLSPELGGNLDVGTYGIVSSTAQNIAITPDTTGRVVLDGLIWPDTDGTPGQVVTTNGSGLLLFDDPAIVGSIDDLTDVDMTTTPPVTGDYLKYNGVNWVPAKAAAYEDVVLRYTAGAGGDLSAGDAVVSETTGITATILDGANCIVEFDFTGYYYPPTSIMVYGQDHANNQWNIRDASSFVGSRAISNDTSVSADSPDLINGAVLTPSIELQLRQSDTGSSADFGNRAYLYVRFLMAG